MNLLEQIIRDNIPSGAITEENGTIIIDLTGEKKND